MNIDVFGTRLWFDVDGPSLMPDDARMRGRPTVILVHGGPVALSLSGSRPVDLVVVEVCRVSRLPGPATVCGTPQRYQRPITTTM